MWLIRTLLLLAEYGVLLLSVGGALVAYLLNLNRVSRPKASRFPLKDIWLEKWVKFRKKQENKSALFDISTSILTIGAAATFIPLIGEVLGVLRETWHAAIANYPYETLRLGVMVLLFALACSLFFLRKYLPRVYAFLEIAIGMAMAWDALRFVQAVAVPDSQLSAYWAGMVFSPNALKVMAAVYVIIRGLVNWNERSKGAILQRTPDAEPPQPKATETQLPSGKQKGKKGKG